MLKLLLHGFGDNALSDVQALGQIERDTEAVNICQDRQKQKERQTGWKGS